MNEQPLDLLPGEQLIETPFQKDIIYRGGVIDVQRWLVHLPGGQTATRDVVLHHGAAAVVPVDEQGYVTMVRQYRTPIGRVTLELPAGKFDTPGEDPLVCAVRELEEETGLRAGRMIKLTDYYGAPAYCTEKVSLFLALDLTRHESHPDPDEYLSACRMPLADLVQSVMSGEIQDGKTIAGILMAQQWLATH